MSVRPGLKAAVSAAAAIAMSAVLAACGPSEGGSGTTAAAGGGSTSSEAVKAAEAAVVEYSQRPTKIPVSEPLDKAPTPDKTFVWMTCQLSGCATMAEQIKTAVESVGWNYRQISYDQANPASLVSGMREALRYDPSYVAMSGVAAESWASVVPEYEKAGVKIIASYLGPLELTDTLLANVNGESLNVLMGEQLADWFIADSDGKGSVLLQTVNDYPSNKILAEAFIDRVAEECPGCRVDTINVGLADAGQGQAVPQVVSKLRTMPDHMYVLGTYLPFLNGLPAALSSAGLEVKIGGGYAAAAEFPLIHSGEFAVGTTTSVVLATYGMVDVALRDETGTALPTGADQSQLLVTDGDFPTKGDYNLPEDAVQQYEKLWGAS